MTATRNTPRPAARIIAAFAALVAPLPVAAAHRSINATDSVEAITLDNIQLELPGGGTAEGAKVQLPEKESAYPEFNTLGKTTPAYGIYARHVRGTRLQHVRTTATKPDARPAKVLIDVTE